MPKASTDCCEKCFHKMQKVLDMTLDLRGRRAARSGLILERAARRPMRTRIGSRVLAHVACDLGLSAAFGMDFVSSGGCSTAFPPHLRRTLDRLHAQPGRLGYARHRGHLPRGALDDLLQADRAGACAGRRPVDPFAATGAKGIPGRTGESDHRRHAGCALREDRAGHQHQARPQPQGQSADLSEQPMLGHVGPGGARSVGFGWVRRWRSPFAPGWSRNPASAASSGWPDS